MPARASTIRCVTRAPGPFGYFLCRPGSFGSLSLLCPHRHRTRRAPLRFPIAAPESIDPAHNRAESERCRAPQEGPGLYRFARRSISFLRPIFQLIGDVFRRARGAVCSLNHVHGGLICFQARCFASSATCAHPDGARATGTSSRRSRSADHERHLPGTIPRSRYTFAASGEER